MTTKEARLWLMRGWRLDREINQLMETRDAVKDRLLSVTASLSGDPVQSTKDPHKFDRLAVLNDEINATVDRYVDTLVEINAAIFKLEDGRYRALLIDRYISNKTWERIAVDENYNIRHIWRLHGEALAAIAPIIENMAVVCQQNQ